MSSEVSRDQPGRIEADNPQHLTELAQKQVSDEGVVVVVFVGFPEGSAACKVFENDVEITVQSIVRNDRRRTHAQLSTLI
jgi:hypothetical protein